MKQANQILKTVGERLEPVVGLLFPPVCRICESSRARPDCGLICELCLEGINEVEPPYCETCGLPFEGSLTTDFECANCREMELHFDFARSAVKANDLVLEVIHRYKYSHELWFEPLLVDWLVQLAQTIEGVGEMDLIVPVPLHPLKLREREFNQAERLAVGLADATGLPVKGRALKRVLLTSTQTSLSRKKRMQNVRRAFQVAAHKGIAGKAVLLVDDVLTTGATTSACAQALKKAGASRVVVLTAVRAVFTPPTA